MNERGASARLEARLSASGNGINILLLCRQIRGVSLNPAFISAPNPTNPLINDTRHIFGNGSAGEREREEGEVEGKKGRFKTNRERKDGKEKNQRFQKQLRQERMRGKGGGGMGEGL